MADKEYIHTKRERKNQKNTPQTEKNAPQYTQDQRDGNFSFDTIHGLSFREMECTMLPKKEADKKNAGFLLRQCCYG